MKISEALQCPLELDVYVKKLINTKHKVTVVSNILQTTQERLNKVHQAVERNTARRKALLETTPPISTPTGEETSSVEKPADPEAQE